MKRARELRIFGGLALLAVGGLALAACGGGGGRDPQLVEAGHQHFLQTCATCHGSDARGKPKLGKALHDNAFTKSLDEQELVEFLKVGRPAWHELNERKVDMPPRGGNPALTDQDLAEIAAYLRTL